MNTKFIKIALASVIALCMNNNSATAMDGGFNEPHKFDCQNFTIMEDLKSNTSYIEIRLVDEDEFIKISFCGDRVIPEYFENLRESIKIVKIPASVKVIGVGTFSGCENLVSVILKYGLGSIEDYAFSGCINLKYINIPDSVKRMGNYVFKNCNSLTEIHIPNNAQLSPESLAECNNLRYIETQNESILTSGYNKYGGNVNTYFNRNTNGVTIYLPNKSSASQQMNFQQQPNTFQNQYQQLFNGNNQYNQQMPFGNNMQQVNLQQQPYIYILNCQHRIHSKLNISSRLMGIINTVSKWLRT